MLETKQTRSLAQSGLLPSHYFPVLSPWFLFPSITVLICLDTFLSIYHRPGALVHGVKASAWEAGVSGSLKRPAWSTQ